MDLPEENEETHPCETCGRHFVASSLAKHSPICKKMARARRKVFDSGKQRATGSDITIDGVKNARKEREKVGGTYPRPKTSWKEKHESFVTTVSASRQVNYALRTGTPLPPPPKTSTPKALTKDDFEDIVRKYKETGHSNRLQRPPLLQTNSANNDYIQCDYCGRSFNPPAAERHIPFCRLQYEKKGPLKISPTVRKSFTPVNKSAERPRSFAENSKSTAEAVPKSRGSSTRGRPTTQNEIHGNVSSRQTNRSRQSSRQRSVASRTGQEHQNDSIVPRRSSSATRASKSREQSSRQSRGVSPALDRSANASSHIDERNPRKTNRTKLAY